MENKKFNFKRLSIFFLIFLLTFTSILALNNDFSAEASKAELKVDYIDVGQGDSILVQLPNGQTSLIDGGPKESSTKVVNYLKSKNIKKIDYLVATHPHEDHIGGLPEVIKQFDIGKIYMPNATNTTQIFEDLLLAIKDKGKTITTAKAGDTILSTDDIKYTVLAPNSDTYEDLNNYSIVLKLTYKNNSFLFMGDAEKLSENEILDKGYDIKANVIKIGHHGSNSSSGGKFITQVGPKYAVISCGKDNAYGHPHQETVDKIKGSNILLYRTDKDGTIEFISDGSNIKAYKSTDKRPAATTPKSTKTTNSNKGSSGSSSSKSKSNSTPAKTKKTNTGSTDKKGTIVYITRTGAKYHRGWCRYLRQSKIPITLGEAKAQGYTPCKICNP